MRTQQERIAESVRRLVLKATQTFPNSKITLHYPGQKAFPPIQHPQNKREISWGSAVMPNVHLAHHPILSIQRLRDHVRLHKDSVSIFGQTVRVSRLKSMTHQANGQPSANVGPSVSVCGPSFCSASLTVGTSQMKACWSSGGACR